MVMATLAALAAEPNLYVRDHQLVHVVGSPESAQGERSPVSEGTPIIRQMAQSTLWERASACADFERYDARAKDYVPADPPTTVLASILSRGDAPGIRPLVGITESPIFRPDGTIHMVPGYDAATKFLFAPTIRFDPPVEHPTQADASRALKFMRDIFVDFPYLAEHDAMVPIASIMTVIARAAIAGACPGFVFDASTRGSGKTLQADAVSLAATGRIAPPMSYPSNHEELEKILGAYALKGPQIVKFDNVTCTFGGGPIDRVLTATDTVEMRVLGRSEIPELVWRAVVLATGNNVVLSGDTSRRVLMGRIESPLENPEERTKFKHSDLLGWIRGKRASIVRAVLTILRAFHLADRPQGPCKTWGSFGAWSALIPPAIVFAGGTDPMLARPAMNDEEEPEKAAADTIIVGLARLDPDGEGLSARAIIDRLYTRERLKGTEPPDGFEDMREAIETLVTTRSGTAPDTKRLGEKLRSVKGRVIRGRKLASAKAHGGVQRWKVIQS